MRHIAAIVVSGCVIMVLMGPAMPPDQSTLAAAPRTTQNPAVTSPNDITVAPRGAGEPPAPQAG
jgi:hypothetical protein